MRAISRLRAAGTFVVATLSPFGPWKNLRRVVERHKSEVPDLTFRSVLPGAVVAVLSWALASLAFSFFLGVFPVHGVAYGSLGTAISLLIYLYVSAAVLLLGAQLNAELRRSASKGGGTHGEAP
jgi:amino acid transporter